MSKVQLVVKKIANYLLYYQYKLGSGAFGQVFLGQEQGNGDIVAIKVISMELNDEKYLLFVQQRILKETQIMRQINHPNIVRLLDVQRTQKNIYLIIEYCNEETLDQYVKKKCQNNEVQYLSEIQALLIINQIVQGYKSLHELRIVHRDLKPQNILINDGVIKICDFGLSTILECDMNQPILQSYAGTPLYMSSQILTRQQYSSKCDIWSLGIIFYEILYGRRPWIFDSMTNMISIIENQQLQFPESPQVRQETKILIKQMLALNEQDRISWEELFQHPYFNQQSEQIQNLSNPINKMNAYFKKQSVVMNFQHARELQSQFSQIMPIQMNTSEYYQQQVEIPKGVKDSNQLLYTFQNIIKQRQMRDILQKVQDWIIHRKNKSAFLSQISTIFFTVQEDCEFLDEQTAYIFMFILAKYQTQILYKMKCRLENRQLEKNKKFDKLAWLTFCESKMYDQSLAAIGNDFIVVRQFFDDLMKQVPQDSQYKSQINMNMVQKAEFDKFFHQVIKEVLIRLQTVQPTVDSMKLTIHLQNGLQMSQLFKFENRVDFFNFKFHDFSISAPKLGDLNNINIQQ
ncbi:hypothetical protein pb186bvf_004365 [Paramecium bursaria]